MGAGLALAFRHRSRTPPSACWALEPARILLRWRNGVFVPEPGTGSLEKAAADAKAENAFLDILARFNRQERNISDKAGPTHAPTIFARESEAKAVRVGKQLVASDVNPTEALSICGFWGRTAIATRLYPNRTSLTKPKPRNRCATRSTVAASRLPSLSRTSIEAGRGFTCRSR